ncbi:HDOD domain-containing protein [Botrimarina sp.]|uniref:HDOD domain-containing protein n=1 Tax=Botrimarina sp. TaxID=2795802 RepID=UPI0032EE27EF
MPPTAATTLEAILARSDRLYSLPTVALEVMRLTDEPTVDAQALCECLQSDPALASKLLRVVNSSLYGLPAKVTSLPQAVALLGVRPLKLLVLGFALPDKLFEGLRADELRRYWSGTLTTAGAARALAETRWGRLGDEALVAGLMQGVGRLALLGQLGEPYAGLLAATQSGRPDRGRLAAEPAELEALGFDHRQLSAALLRRWGLPECFSDAIELQSSDPATLDRLRGDAACLAQSLWLASRAARLLVDRELLALDPLLRWGSRWCGLSSRSVNDLLASLLSRVRQMADALAVEIPDQAAYERTLGEAQRRLAAASDEAAIGLLNDAPPAEPDLGDDRVSEDLLNETQRLSAAVRDFLLVDPPPVAARPAHSGAEGPRAPHRAEQFPSDALQRLSRHAELAVRRCRQERRPLSLALVCVSVAADDGRPSIAWLRSWLAGAHWADDLNAAAWTALNTASSGVHMPGLDRHDAHRVWSGLATDAARESGAVINVGVAGVTQVSRTFCPEQLIEAAGRCLAAAIEVAGPAVKSIELF